MKNINFRKIALFGIVALAIVGVFAIPSSAHAYWGYNYGAYNPGYAYNQYSNYGYGAPAYPTYVAQPVVIPVSYPVITPVAIPVAVPTPVIVPVPTPVVVPVATPRPVYTTPIYSAPRLDIGCYSDPVSVTTDQPVTWNAEVTGGIGPYTYSWTGSEGLYGSQPTVIKYYSSYGEKSAIVTVTSADGLTATKACSNTLTIKSKYVAPKTVVKTVPVTKTVTTEVKTDSNSGQAAAVLSLGNVPWGWIAVLIILILFATVVYLLFNRNKI